MKNHHNKFTYISLFSGAGVGCYGFLMEDFDCIATVEIIERRLKIQKHNNKCRYEGGYIADDITKEQTKEKIISEIDFWENNHRLKEVDVILATPPCQGMSVANHKKNNERKRNSLVVESIKLINQIRPKVFVFENVRAFLTTECTDLDGKNKSIREAVELNLGGKYNVHYQVLNFKDYGNPTSRTRTLVIGTRKDLREITPINLLPKFKNGGTVRNAIGDLPPLKVMGENVKNDINIVLKIIKMEKPNKINLFIAREKFYKDKEEYSLEYNALKNNLEDLEKLFSCKVTLNKAEDSKDAKANKAKVGKPAILIE